MLICPQCKFENPKSNKFCQSCGTSLTHKVCPECSAEDVPVNALLCHNCGTECGTVFWAIIAKETIGEALGVKIDEGDVGLEEDEEAISSSSPLSLSSQITLGSYLDSQERYQLLDPLPTQSETATITVTGVRVLDCQPYQISPIEAILASQQSDLLTPSVDATGIPHLAKPYIALHSQSGREIPLIHDAWQQGDMQVVIIEDRSNWQLLLDLWQEETTSSLKILHWCYQMTQLWALLEPVNCRQSLLDFSNLRLDEDQTLALQRLYVESSSSLSVSESSEDAEAQTSAIPEEPLTIQALGRVWQALFRQSQRTQFGSVVQMLGDLDVGKIHTIAQLRSRLEEISIELEALGTATLPPIKENNTTVPTMPQSDEPEDIISKIDDMPTVVLAMQLSSLEDAGRTDVAVNVIIMKTTLVLKPKFKSWSYLKVEF